MTALRLDRVLGDALLVLLAEGRALVGRSQAEGERAREEVVAHAAGRLRVHVARHAEERGVRLEEARTGRLDDRGVG